MAETRKPSGRVGVCTECVKINGPKYRKGNEERQKYHGQRYYEANREKVLERQKLRYTAKREEIRLYSQKWHLANRQKLTQYRLIHQLKKQYGLTLEQYNAMLAEQHGLCAICKKPPTKRRLDVDHDHADGHVRQLLCERCNKGLGCFGDSLELLETAVRYMRKHSQLRLVG